jgi:hypothetical protein
MKSDDTFKAAVQAVSEVSSYGELQRTMLAWAPRFHAALFAKRIAPGPRPELGMDISIVPGRCGFTAKRGEDFLVSIGNETSTAEKRFTLAHELGHVLLGSAGRSLADRNPAKEERLCESFASRAIARRYDVDEYLRDAGLPTDIADVRRFAKRFRVTLRASLVVLGDFLPGRWPVAFVAASWKPHRQRDVWGVRVEAAAADHRFYLPPEGRLMTIGLRELEAFVLRREIGAEEKGRDRRVEIPSRRGRIPGWTGPSTWTAEVHRAPGSTAEDREPGVLCCIDVTELKPMHTRPSPRSRGAWRLNPVGKVPGQMDLDRRS